MELLFAACIHLLSLAQLSTPAAASVVASSPASEVLQRYVDLYGSDQITMQQVEAKVGSQLRAYLDAVAAEDYESVQRLDAEICAAIDEMGDFALVELSRIQYFTEGHPVYVTIDLVDADEREARMTFGEAPSGQVDGVDDLLAAWAEYQDAGFELMRAGEMPGQGTECPAYHCVFKFPGKLAPFGERFEAEVPKQQATLRRVLLEDADAADRANAAFLLAHTDDGEALVELMLEVVDDPSSVVRNNALRVLGAIANDHPEVEIPLDPILRALDYPLTTDRNKVLYILAGLAKRPELQAEIARRAGAKLLDILHLRQPNNHDFAYQILKEISGEDFGARDYAAWRQWLDARNGAPSGGGGGNGARDGTAV